MNTTFFSICIPVYNGERFLQETIQSVLNQDFSDFELLIVDNASTDGTRDIISSFHDQRIKVIRNEKPDIIHTHMSKAGLLGRVAALLSFSGVKTVHSYHGHVLEGYFHKFFAQIIIHIERYLGKLTDAFIFDGHQIMLEINNYGIRPRKSQQVILPGLIKHMSNKNQVCNESLQILVVARIEKVKRIDLILTVAQN